MWRHFVSNALTFLIVALIGAAGAIAWGKAQYKNPGPLAQAICFRVEQGSTFSPVSEALFEQGAVADARILRIGARYESLTGALKAGAFLVPEGASMQEIVAILTGDGRSTCGTEVVMRIGVTAWDMRVRALDPATGQFEIAADFVPGRDPVPEAYTRARAEADTRYRVLVVEGTTVWQVAEGLRAAEFLSGDIGTLPAEGLLAPDSYEVDADITRSELLARMEAVQRDRLARAWEGRADTLPISTAEEALTLASIIEKETAVAEERLTVAGVFTNRLERGMRLQTDPTVIYGLTLGRAPLGRGLRRSELNRATPYNTYLIPALPPTPIANPGQASIEAAVNPEKTEYIFFVADGTGGHAFAETLAQHNENVRRWRQIEAERRNQ